MFSHKIPQGKLYYYLSTHPEVHASILYMYKIYLLANWFLPKPYNYLKKRFIYFKFQIKFWTLNKHLKELIV